jgi:cell division inhibitor SulA
LFRQLTQSIKTNQWIWFTSQSVRPSATQLASFHIPANQVIQLKASTNLTEFEVATKAIKSSNACALVVSNSMTSQQRHHLEALGSTYQCNIFYTDSHTYSYH